VIGRFESGVVPVTFDSRKQGGGGVCNLLLNLIKRLKRLKSQSSMCLLAFLPQKEAREMCSLERKRENFQD
jgi:hypothetical protein